METLDLVFFPQKFFFKPLADEAQAFHVLKAGAVNDAHRGVFKRLVNFEIVSGVVLEIRVLDQNDVTGGLREAGPNRRTLTLILVMKKQFNALPPFVGRLNALPRAVGGAVIDNENFFFYRDGDDTVDERADALDFV